MKMRKLTGLCCMLSLAAGLAGAGVAFGIGTEPLPASIEANETMPVLTGDLWKTMQHESKVAFIWGVGHVVTVEEHVVQRHPELKRSDFVSKLGEGLRGIPMNNIIQTVDDYYRANPQDTDLPVMRVIWRQIVKPKLKTGIADRPLTDNEK